MTPKELRNKRLSLNFTQQKLSQILDLSSQQISNYESGRTSIPEVVVLAVKYLLTQKEGEGGRLQHLTHDERGTLLRFASALRENLGQDIVMMAVFGSKVRGDHTEDSDIDFLIVLKRKDVAARKAIFDTLYTIDPYNEHRIAPVIYSLEDFQKNEAINSPFTEIIKKEGAVL